MLIVGSALSLALNIAAAVFCLLAGIGALLIARDLSPPQQNRALQRDGGGDGGVYRVGGGDGGSLSSVRTVLAFRLLYIVVALVFLAVPVLAIAGVIPWD
jgi:hypothetical protein